MAEETYPSKSAPGSERTVEGRFSPLARTFGALLGTQAVGRVIRFLYMIVIARTLGPEQTGILLYGLAVFLSLAIFANLAQGAFLATRLNQSRSRTGRLVSHSLTLNLMATALATAMGLVVVWFHIDRPLTAQVIALLLAALVARSLVGWVRECHVALEDATWIPRYEALFRSAEALVGTALLLSGAGLLAICLLHFLFWALEAVFTFRLFVSRSGFRLRPGGSRRLLARAAGVSLVLTVSLGCLYLFGQVGVIALQWLQPDTAVVGHFGLAMQFLGVLLVAPLMFGSALVPALARVRRAGGELETTALTTVVKAVLVGGGITAVLAEAYAPWLVTTAFGPRFQPAGEVFTWVCWALGPCAVILIVGQALNGLAGRAAAATMALATIGLHVLGMMLLMPIGPLQAAAVSLLAASFAGAGLGLLALCPRIGIAGHGWWLVPLVALAGMGLVMKFWLAPTVWTAPLISGLLLLLAWWSRILSRKDLDFVLARLGLHGRVGGPG